MTTTYNGGGGRDPRRPFGRVAPPRVNGAADHQRDPRNIGGPAVPAAPATRSVGGMPGSSGNGQWALDARIREAQQKADLEDFFAFVNSQGAGGSPTNGGGGGGSWGGGGGANNAARKKALDDLLGTVGTAVSADRAAASSRFAALDQYMAGLGNPYASVGPAQQAQVNPNDLAALLQSQGGSDAGLRAQAQFLQAQNGATAGASNQQMAVLRAAQDAWNQGSRTSGRLAGEQTDAELAAQLLAMQTAIGMQRAAL